MVDFDGASLSDAERAFLRALNARGVRYLIVGMSAALLHVESTLQIIEELDRASQGDTNDTTGADKDVKGER